MIASKVSFHQLNNNGLHRNYLKQIIKVGMSVIHCCIMESSPNFVTENNKPFYLLTVFWVSR